jgi:hypothetical protein
MFIETIHQHTNSHAFYMEIRRKLSQKMTSGRGGRQFVLCA